GGMATEAAFAEAVKLFKAGEVARALPLFQELGDKTVSPNVYLYIGYCQLELGRDREAHRAFSTALRQARDLGNDKYETTREAAQEELVRLNLRLATITIALMGQTTGVMVRLDGELLDPSLLESPMIVSPGNHHVQAQAAGWQPVTRDVNVVQGDSKAIALLLDKKVEPVPAAVPPQQGQVVKRSPRASSLTTLGLVVGAVGVAGLGTFAVAGFKTRSLHDRLQTECANGCSDSGHQSDAQSGRTYQAIANVGLAVGIAGTLTGAALIYWGIANKKSAQPTLAIGSGLVAISYQASF
ncbi:MAG TPA: hypothetical protein VIM14_08430, partial [Polyangia bacterium]